VIGILTWEIYGGGKSFTVTAGSLNIDEMNVPAITGSFMVPFDEDTFQALDPRQTPVPRVLLTGTFSEWATAPISAITDYMTDNGVTQLSGLSTLWVGLTLADISAMFGTPLSGTAPLEPTVMTLDLHVREIDASDFDMVISVASDEALLTDWVATDGLDFGAISDYASGMDVQKARTYIDPILQHVLGIRTDTNVYSTTALSTVYTSVINRTLDMSAWEIILQPLNDANLKLRVNRDGKGFSLQHPVNEIPTKEWFSLLTDSDVVTARRVYSRNSDWYDSSLLTAGDATATRVYKGGPTAVHSRTYRERFQEGTPLTSSQVVNINRRNSNRGQFIDIVAPIKLGVFMMDEFAYAPAGEAVQQWRVQGVSYDFAAGTMNIRGVQRY
jgi:hypothetical protein